MGKGEWTSYPRSSKADLPESFQILAPYEQVLPVAHTMEAGFYDTELQVFGPLLRTGTPAE